MSPLVVLVPSDPILLAAVLVGWLTLSVPLAVVAGKLMKKRLAMHEKPR